MNFKNFILLACVLCLLSVLLTCKKDKNTIHIKGTVYDPNQKINVQGAHVILQSSTVQSGIYSGSYQDIATGTTDASGNFNFDIAVARVIGYKIIINKDKYFYSETDIGPQNWSGGNTYNPVYNIYPIGYVKLYIENTHPYDLEDLVLYTISIPDYAKLYPYCSGCCSDTARSGKGMYFRATFKCITQGATKTNISWDFTHNGIDIKLDTNLYCLPSDTTFIKIQY